MVNLDGPIAMYHRTISLVSGAEDYAGPLGTLDTFRTTVAQQQWNGPGAYEASLDYAKNREMFGQTLSVFQAPSLSWLTWLLRSMQLDCWPIERLGSKTQVKSPSSRRRHSPSYSEPRPQPYHKRRGPDSRRCRIGEGESSRASLPRGQGVDYLRRYLRNPASDYCPPIAT
ncbi:MAG: hypothetical protein CM1200mP27_07610 [Chloroflexota bacterium]|nr:MAG: hypothetical protein CM1200mP27_07610 [Chloroflexota bacterium]